MKMLTSPTLKGSLTGSKMGKQGCFEGYVSWTGFRAAGGELCVSRCTRWMRCARSGRSV